ncbi:MAG: hypothetical protein GZ089_02970 [Aromatoleum sp.]|nr:hypothetical protein [Aromatoleum sp.]
MNLVPRRCDLERTMARCVLVVCAALMTACGGGGGQFASGGIVGTGAAAVLSVGTISAFGAGTLTVNGLPYATAAAVITVNGQPATASALKLGMVVTVQGGVKQADGSVIASSIVYRPDIQGVVSGVDVAGQAFIVLGQRVRTDRQTVFDGGTFDTLLNQHVEVSGFRASPGELLATRVEIRASIAKGAALEVTGVVSQLDGAGKTFFIGPQLIDYTQTPQAVVPPGLANGVLANAKGTAVGAGDRLLATQIQVIPTALPAPDAAQVEIEGLVASFANLGSFLVNGQLVDGRAAVFEYGSAASVADGVRVEVEGRLASGIVVASRIAIEEDAAVVIDGLAEAVDSAGGTVTVSAQRVTATANTQFDDRSAAAVRDFGLAAIRVGDRLSVSATHGTAGLTATRITRLDLSAPTGSQPDASAEGIISAFISTANFMVGAQTVNASSATFVNGAASDLANGKRVAAAGTLSGTILLATTVTFKVEDPTSPGTAEVEGAISAFVSAANFVVTGQKVDASGAAFDGGSAGSLANGVRVKASGPLANGVLVATTVSIESAPATTIEVEGTITNFVSVSNFKIAGQTVDASKASIENGSASDLANGRQCHATGPAVNGVLQASVVTLEDAAELQGASAKGLITNFLSASNFKVGGRTIDASGAIFENGTAANLGNGAKVEVEGALVGIVLRASKVAFDD